MTRRLVWGTVALISLLVLLGVAFIDQFEQVDTPHWTPPGKEARRDPYLALDRFLAAMGRPLQRTSDASQLDHLPAGGVLILDNRRRAHLSSARQQQLLAWVANGGYLLAVAESNGVDDPLLDFFDVSCCSAAPLDAAARKPKPLPERLGVVIPNAARPLQINAGGGRLTPGETVPAWQAGAADWPAQLLHFPHGRGQVTLLSSLGNLFDNRHIGHLDHAELLWTLLETYQPDHRRPLTLLTRLSTPSLADWLLESAWTASLSAAVLIALWLWSVVPRFGQALPTAAPARRELREHLTAIGRYVWRVGGLDFWLETARAHFRNRLALRHPGLLALPPAEQAMALAALTQRPASLIAAALHQNAHSPQSFTLALRTLRNLERSL